VSLLTGLHLQKKSSTANPFAVAYPLRQCI
jgi:hypothetical protein